MILFLLISPNRISNRIIIQIVSNGFAWSFTVKQKYYYQQF